MRHSDTLISEAVFCELGQKQWRKGLWNELKAVLIDVESAYIDALEYQQKFPNSPDVWSRCRALGRILDSVSEKSRSLEINEKMGVK